MKDVNWPLRKIYNTRLTGISYNSVTVRAFYQAAPDDITDQNYIVFSSVDNNDVSSKSNADTDTSMQVVIHTFESKYNSGRAADAIAGYIFTALYPDPQAAQPDMSADGLQIVTTKLTGDRTLPYNIQSATEYIDRILTFTHRIFHY